MKNLKLKTALRERGISLIEGVLYLVIALAVIVGGIVFFQQAQLSNAVTDTARAGVSISSETRALYQSQRSFGNADITGALIAAGAVPSNFLNAAGTAITHPFGGTVTVRGNDTGFAVTYVDLSEAACLRLSSVGEGGQGQLGTGIQGVTIAATAPTDLSTGPVLLASDGGVTASEIAGPCSTADRDVTVFYGR